MSEVNAAAADRADVAFLNIADITCDISLEVLLVDTCIVVTGLVGAGDEVEHVGDFFVFDKLAFNADRTGKTDIGTGSGNDHFRISQSDFVGIEQLSELDFIDVTVASDHNSDRFAVNIIDQCLDELLDVFLKEVSNFLDRSGMRCFHQGHFFEIFLNNDRLALAGGDFDIGRQVAVVTEDENIFAHRCQCLEFLGEQTAHDAGVSADDAVVKVEAVHDVLIGIELLGICFIKTGFVFIERVGILHDEFTDTDQTIAGTRLVTELCLELIEGKRHVLVGADLHLGSSREEFFMGRTQYIRHAFAVTQGEHRFAEAVTASGSDIDIFRDEGRHQKFLGTGLVHLIADDSHDILQDLVAERQHHINTGRALLDISGSDQQIGTDGILVFHILTQSEKITVFIDIGTNILYNSI